jgi:hypothetical protein
VPYPSATDLMAAASEEVGLDDFGPGDFRAGLERLLESLECDARFDGVVASRVLGDFERRLRNRLHVEAWYAKHPELENVVVEGPVDINGLPRSGTTALANMMSLDPQFRCLRNWEQLQPCPPPELEREAHDPRRLAELREHERVSARLNAMHLFDVDATFEDTELLGMAFHGQGFTLPIYGYQSWWRSSDMLPTYRYHRRVIQLLQSRRPPARWLFKAPHHNFNLEAVVAVYPDARFVVTHRDPARAVPSWASFVAAIMPESEGAHDLHRLGRAASEHLRIGVERGIAARKGLGDQRFIDVHHRELLANPMRVLHRIYEFAGLELRRGVEMSIRDWTAVNRAGSRGVHHYAAEQFGLTTAGLRSEFDFYIRHFDVDIEP